MYFVDYDMVQSEILFVPKREKVKPESMGTASLFNAYILKR